jgi:ribonuclease BN (tRNA processing enzyme)
VNKNVFKGRTGARLGGVLFIAAVGLQIMTPARSLAQDASPGEAQKGLQILLLGTHGGPALVKERSEPATVLTVDGRSYLIDCGIGTMRRILDAGVQSQRIGTIFITHYHPDHALGLVDVLANDYHHLDLDAPRSRQEFNIYGPPQTPALVSAAYDYIKIPYGVFAAEPIGRSALFDPFKAHVIDHDGLVYQDNRIRVTAAENTHYQLIPLKYQASMKSYSYRFETPYGAVVFTGDTGPSAAVEALAKDADVLITEVEDLDAIEIDVRGHGIGNAGNADKLVEHMRIEHLPMKAVGELASKANVKAVILDHYVGGDDAERFTAGVKAFYSGPVFAGEDLARYCLAAGIPSGGSGSRSLETAPIASASKLALCP